MLFHCTNVLKNVRFNVRLSWSKFIFQLCYVEVRRHNMAFFQVDLYTSLEFWTFLEARGMGVDLYTDRPIHEFLRYVGLL